MSGSRIQIRYRIASVVLLQVALLFMLLYQNNRYITQLYAVQAVERERVQLQAQLEIVTQKRARLQDRGAIAAYATHELGMQPIALRSVHTIADIVPGNS